jgi:hypothetical protein
VAQFVTHASGRILAVAGSIRHNNALAIVGVTSIQNKRSAGAIMELIGHITEVELPIGLILFVAGVVVGFAAGIVVRRRG